MQWSIIKIWIALFQADVLDIFKRDGNHLKRRKVELGFLLVQFFDIVIF